MTAAMRVGVLWDGEDVKNIHQKNLQLYQSEIGQKMLRMLRHFQGGDRTGPNSNSPIWILEILQNAIDAGAKTLRIHRIPGEGFLITHDNFHRAEQGITLEELQALCNISTTTKSLTSVGFFGIGFKSIFYVFKRVTLQTVSAPGGGVCLDVGGEIPLERSDLLKAVLPTWTTSRILAADKLLNTSFFLTGCRFDETQVAKAVSDFLSNSSLLRSVLKVHGLENIYYSSKADNISMSLAAPSACDTFVARVSWRPSTQAYQTLQRLRDLDIPRDQTGVNDYSAMVSGFLKLPLCRDVQGHASNIASKSFVFCTFPTHDLTGLQFSVDGPFLLDANRLHLRWESGCGEWNTEIISQCLPELICQFASWLPSYLSTIADPTSFKNELHEGLNIILSWGNKKRKLDYAETRNIHDTLMTVFQSLTSERSSLCDQLSTIPFIPLRNGKESNQVTWISLREVIWPADARQTSTSLHSHPIADSWFALLPNAHYLYPSLPNLDDHQMKLLYALVSWVSPELLRYDTNSFKCLTFADMKRWYCSFPESRKEERNAGLVQIWKKCLAENSPLPCLPTQKICTNSKGTALVFKALHEEFYFVPTPSSTELAPFIPSKWSSLIQQCIDLGKFEYYQIPVELNPLFKDETLSRLPKSTMSLNFVNQLLHSLEDDNVRFPLALEFVLEKSYNQSFFWVIDSSLTTGCSIIQVKTGSILSPLPQEWLPTPALHTKYLQLTSSSSQRFSIDSRLSKSFSEYHCGWLKSSCLMGLLQLLIEKICGFTKDELLALEFASPLHSVQTRTGWGSKRGYDLKDWKFSTFGKAMKSDLLPYLLVRFPIGDLRGTFYRSTDTQFSPTGHRPSQWVREIIPYLSQWKLIPSLTDLCQELETVLTKEPNLLPTTVKTISSTADRLPLPSLEELRRRDQVMRYLFAHRNWVTNAEYELKRSFVSSSLTLLPDFPLLIDDEWEVSANRTDLGRGDLLFCSSDGKKVAVVELKANSSSTAESVKDQARNYATLYHQMYVVETVRGYIVRKSSSLLTFSSSPVPEFVCVIGS
jgi:hypothetical protein